MRKGCVSCMANMAVIGDRDSVLLFKAIGLDVFCENHGEGANGRLHKLVHDGYAVIFVTEEYYAACQETIAAYVSEAYPAIIPIPSNRGAEGIGMQLLKKNVEKAVGVDILFNS